MFEKHDSNERTTEVKKVEQSYSEITKEQLPVDTQGSAAMLSKDTENYLEIVKLLKEHSAKANQLSVDRLNSGFSQINPKPQLIRQDAVEYVTQAMNSEVSISQASTGTESSFNTSVTTDSLLQAHQSLNNR